MSTAASAVSRAPNPSNDAQVWYGAVEAQWVLAVLDDVFASATLVSYLTEDILTDPVIDQLDHEVVIALREYFQVEKHFGELLQNGNGGDGTAQELRLMLADTLRTIVRLLKQNPVLVRRLRELGSKRTAAVLQFINNLARLQALAQDTLRQTVEDETAEQDLLKRLRQREKVDKTRFIQLTKRLTLERRQHSESIADKDRRIARVRSQIDEIKRKTQQTRDTFETKMAEQGQVQASLFKDTEHELTEELEELQRRFTRTTEESITAEMSLHRKKHHQEQDIETLIRKYDADLTETHRAHTAMQALYDRESEELRQLRDYFGQVDEEAARIRAEVDAINEARDTEVVQERKREQAADMMHALFNRFQQKRGLGPAKKKKKRRKKKTKK